MLKEAKYTLTQPIDNLIWCTGVGGCDELEKELESFASSVKIFSKVPSEHELLELLDQKLHSALVIDDFNFSKTTYECIVSIFTKVALNNILLVAPIKIYHIF